MRLVANLGIRVQGLTVLSRKDRASAGLKRMRGIRLPASEFRSACGDSLLCALGWVGPHGICDAAVIRRLRTAPRSSDFEYGFGGQAGPLQSFGRSARKRLEVLTMRVVVA
jgi:hypothetical protein